MNAALCALHEVVARTPQPYKNLIPSFVSILKQARLACHTRFVSLRGMGSYFALMYSRNLHLQKAYVCKSVYEVTIMKGAVSSGYARVHASIDRQTVSATGG